MTAILLTICGCAVIFLVYFLVALWRDQGKRVVMAYLLRIESEPKPETTFETTAISLLTRAERGHRPLRRRAVRNKLPLIKRDSRSEAAPAGLLRRSHAAYRRRPE